ncbi:amine sulfotransferase-like isoform X1 [Styela clava]
MDKWISSLSDENKAIWGEFAGEIMQVWQNPNYDFSKHKSTEYKGYLLPPFFEAETIKRAYEEMKVEEGSVFVMSFPRTGEAWSHWTIEILNQMLYGDEKELYALSQALPPPLTHIEIGLHKKLELYEHLPFPRKLFGSHLPVELVNLEKIRKANAKIVVVERNPKDQAVSWFHFAHANPSFKSIKDDLSTDWTQFLNDYVAGKHPLITKPGEWYPEHLLGWYKHKDEENVYFLHFENMRKSPAEEMKNLAVFLGIEITSDRIDEISQATLFENMKIAKEGKGDFEKKMGIMRKGHVGSWKENFTKDQSTMIDKLIQDKLGHVDIKFTYE